MNKKGQDEMISGVIITLVVIGIILIIVFCMWIYPAMKPWWAEQDGKAELAQAEQNRQIKIIEAEAANTAATSQAETKIKIAQAEAQAEVERAKGVAQANQIIGDSLKGNEDYLRYLYVTGITQNTAKEVVYIPTEATLPILEAGKRGIQ